MKPKAARSFENMLDDNDKQWIAEAVISPLLHEIGRRHEELNARLDSIDARLKLQAGLIQSGARAMARFSEFSENSEARWLDLDRRLRSLEHRVGPPEQPTL